MPQVTLFSSPSYYGRLASTGIPVVPRPSFQTPRVLRYADNHWRSRLVVNPPPRVSQSSQWRVAICRAVSSGSRHGRDVPANPATGVNVAALGKAALELSLGSNFVDDVIFQLLLTAEQLGYCRDELAIKQAVFLQVIKRGGWAPDALLNSLAAAAASRIEQAEPGTLRMSQLTNVALQFAAATCPPDDDNLASSAGLRTTFEGGASARAPALAPSVLHLFECISITAQRHLERCSGQELADLAWALTRVGVGLGQGAGTPAVELDASAHASTQGGTATAERMAGDAVAGASMPASTPHDGLSWPSLCRAAVAAAGAGNAHEAGILAFRFARAGMADAAVLGACAQRVTYASGEGSVLGSVLLHEFPRLLLRFHLAANTQARVHTQAQAQAQAQAQGQAWAALKAQPRSKVPAQDGSQAAHATEDGPCYHPHPCPWWPPLEAAFAREMARRCATADLASLETLAVRLLDMRVGWQESMVAAARDAIARRDWSVEGEMGRDVPGVMDDAANSSVTSASGLDSTGMPATGTTDLSIGPISMGVEETSAAFASMGIKDMSRAMQRLAWAGLLGGESGGDGRGAGSQRSTSLMSRVLAEVAARVSAEDSAKFLAESALHLSLAGARDEPLMTAMAARAGEVMHLHRVSTQVRAAAKFAAAGVHDACFYARVAAAAADARSWDTSRRYEDQERALADMAAGRFSPLSHLALWTLWLSAKSVPKPKPLTVGEAIDDVSSDDVSSDDVSSGRPSRAGSQRQARDQGEQNEGASLGALGGQAIGTDIKSFLRFEHPDRPLAIDVGCGFGSFVLGMACHPTSTVAAVGDSNQPAVSNRTPCAGKPPPPCREEGLAGEPCNWLGIDVQPQAILRASSVAHRWGLDGRVRFVQGEAVDYLRCVLDEYPGPVWLVCIGFPTPYRLQQGGEDDGDDADAFSDGDLDDDNGKKARKEAPKKRASNGGSHTSINGDTPGNDEAPQGAVGPLINPPTNALEMLGGAATVASLVAGAAVLGPEVRGDRLFMVQPELVELCSRALAPGGCVFIQSNSEEVAQTVWAQFDNTGMFATPASVRTAGTATGTTASAPSPPSLDKMEGGAEADSDPLQTGSSAPSGTVMDAAATLAAAAAGGGAAVGAVTSRIRRDVLWRQRPSDGGEAVDFWEANPFPAQTETEAACERSSRTVYRIQLHKTV
eukprot:jgi/Mesvir1/2904/Mv13975-RA.1